MSTAMSKQQAELNLSSSSSDKAQARTDSVEDSQQNDEQVHDLEAEQAYLAHQAAFLRKTNALVEEQVHLAHQAAFLRRANTTLEKVIADMNQLMEKLVVMALNYCSDEVVPEGEQLLHDQIIQSNKDVCIKLNEVATVTSILLEKISSITIQDTDETPDPE